MGFRVESDDGTTAVIVKRPRAGVGLLAHRVLAAFTLGIGNIVVAFASQFSNPEQPVHVVVGSSIDAGGTEVPAS